MDHIQHKFVEIGSLDLHVPELGPIRYDTDLLCVAATAIVIVFLHGFPEIWYSWRHQMVGVANVGYRALAPDFRGYGLSEVPAEPGKTNFIDLVDDLLGILDHYKIQKVFLVAKDFGSEIAYDFELLHPDRVLGVVTLGVPYVPDALKYKLFAQLPEGFYVRRWMKPGRAEADFGRFRVKEVVRRIYILFSRDVIPIATKENQEIMDIVNYTTPLPPWFTKKDLNAYGKLYERSGFRTPLQIPYRAKPVNLGKIIPRVTVPALHIIGGKDYFYKLPGIKQYIMAGEVKKYVPHLTVTFLSEGTHFIQEQYPKKVNKLIIKFLKKHT
ncbi:Epoxide hydrolase [Thalictrum thalictroides]|uniref:Epoxide hydrolase n=1 Tax=Thalictrum thalictroides TaxID=46969 RepID=A0A7J6VJQ0_THATH|nr:Epoxide hydrolase [Thalictrum thalictroides]